MGGIAKEVRGGLDSWSPVEEKSHRFSRAEFRERWREPGHPYGNRLENLPLRVRVREELVGLCGEECCRVVSESGCTGYRVGDSVELEGVVAALWAGDEWLLGRGEAAKTGGGP